MRILIIGGTNFIGPYLVRQLTADGHYVILFHRGLTPAKLPGGAEHIFGDIADPLGPHARNARVASPSRKSEPRTSSVLSEGGAEHIFGDIADLPLFRDALLQCNPDIAVHMIAYTELQAKNFVGTLRGIVPRVVVVSSMDVYQAYGRFLGLESGPPATRLLDETSPLRAVHYPYRVHAKGPEDLAFQYEKIPS